MLIACSHIFLYVSTRLPQDDEYPPFYIGSLLHDNARFIRIIFRHYIERKYPPTRAPFVDADTTRLILFRCVEVFNEGTLNWIDMFYSDRFEWTQYPGHNGSACIRGDIILFRRTAERILHLFPDRKLRVINSLAENNSVVLDQEWEGTAAMTGNGYVNGRTARMKVISFFTLEDDLIRKQIDYCLTL